MLVAKVLCLLFVVLLKRIVDGHLLSLGMNGNLTDDW